MSAAQKLDDYIKTSGVKPGFLADQLGIQYVTLYHIKSGRSLPSLALAVRIEQVAGIAPREWIE